MNLNLTGVHLDITPAIRAYVVAKLDRVNRHFDHVIDVNVVLSVDKLRQKVEANVHVRGKDIHAEAIEPDMYAAIDALADKLDRQVLKHKEKLVRTIAPTATTIERPLAAPSAGAAGARGSTDRRYRPLPPCAAGVAGAAAVRSGTHVPPRPDEPDRRAAPAANILLDLDVAIEGATCSTRSARAVRGAAPASTRARSSCEPRRTREARLHRASARASRFRTAASRASREARGAFVRLRQPVAVRRARRQARRAGFVLLVPEQATDLHLQLLSELAQMFSERAFREQARAARRTPTTVADAVRDGTRRPDRIGIGERHAPGQRPAAVRRQPRAARTALARRARRAATAC